MAIVIVKMLFSLLGKLLGGRSLHWIGCREEDGTSLIGASCVDVKRKLSIIFLFIVRWQKVYGILFLRCVVYSGSFLIL